uniref:Integral membrane protein n=4 Tax=Aegilops tauschii subsp. strangulata TaxID=200361 RepID=A0A453MHX7_AEGTS
MENHPTKKSPRKAKPNSATSTMSMATTALLRLAPLPPQPRLLAPSSKKPSLLLAPLGSGRRAAGALRLARAAGDGLADQTVYNGVYGPWSVDDADVREVLLYRAGLVTAAASFLVAASGAFLPEGNAVGDAVRQGADLFYAAGAGGLGLSLVLIHIYVTPIKRFLQALWAVGVLGSVGTYALAARPLDEGLVRYVLEHPGAMWFVGPTFAALTGLVFKEGLCYGKLEAGILTFVIPILLLGHLSGLMDDGTKMSLLGVWMALFTVFAARKFQQPIKDDIGDKSVFIFNALPEEEKKALLQRLEAPTEQKTE